MAEKSSPRERLTALYIGLLAYGTSKLDSDDEARDRELPHVWSEESVVDLTEARD